MKGIAFRTAVVALIICLLLSSQSAAAAGKLYVASPDPNNKVLMSELDGTGIVDLGNLNGTLINPAGMALDPVHGTMYVTSFSGNSVSRANLDGTGAVSLGNLGGLLDYPNDVALDIDGGKMYIASERYGGFGTVVRANLNGTGVVNLGNLNGLLDWATGIAIDVDAGNMYVVSYWNNCVVRANLDGTGAVRLAGLDGYLSTPLYIALDKVNGKMYVTSLGWYDQTKAVVVRANLDGTGAESLGNLNGLVEYPVNIALDVDAGKMYVTSADHQLSSAGWRAVKANLDGTGAVDFGTMGSSTGVSHLALLLDNPPVVPPVDPPVVPPDVQFADLNIKATIKGSAFTAKGSFVLGTGSDGISPLTEQVIFLLGDKSYLLPAGALMEIKSGHYVFGRIAGGIEYFVQITAARAGKYKFKVKGSGFSNLPASNPVTLGLKVGDDSGTVASKCRIR